MPPGIVGALPSGHPVACERKPVRPDANAHGRLPGRGRGRFAHRIVLGNRIGGRLGDHIHNVACAIVGRQVVEDAPVRGLADAHFLRPIAPLDDVMPRAEALHGAEMVHIRLTRVAQVRFCEPEEIARPLRR